MPKPLLEFTCPFLGRLLDEHFTALNQLVGRVLNKRCFEDCELVWLETKHAASFGPIKLFKVTGFTYNLTFLLKPVKNPT